MDASEQTSLFDLNTNFPHSPEKGGCRNESHRERAVQRSSEISRSIVMSSGPNAADIPQLVNLVSHIFNESFGFRPDGKPYRLGPKSVSDRLRSTDYLFIAGSETSGTGYLFGKEIPSSFGRIAWIESMAVLPLYRNQGTASALVHEFFLATKKAFFFGCATPNPIAAYIVDKIVPGQIRIGPHSASSDLYRMLQEIRQHCFDLKGCSIDQENFRIKTGFSPLSRSDERQWKPRGFKEAPTWWSAIEHLPNEYEALLVIKRSSDVRSQSYADH